MLSLKPAEISIEEVHAAIERICVSSGFSRSERSRKFLRYVCDLTLRGEASRINEYLIGSEVFQRGAEYSPHLDSVVRRQAHVLRQKLVAYYALEGSDDPIQIELPVGGYVPLFRQRAWGAIPPTTISKPAERSKFRARTLASLAAVTLLIVGWVLGRSTSVVEVHPPLPPVAREIWGPWLDDPADVVICVSNPMTATVKYEPNLATRELALHRFRVSAPEETAFRQIFGLPPGGYLYMIPSRANAKMGESLALALLTAFFTSAARPVRATQSRLISWEDFRSQNFILLGHSEANQWIDPLLGKYPFRLGETEGQRLRYILNTSPAEGEASEYEVEQTEDTDGNDRRVREYALVSMIPGLDRGRKLLLINGLNTQATQMATELLTAPDHLHQLHARLNAAAPSHKGPWYFQAIIRTEVRDKVATTGPEIVALRVL